ncbi:Egg protein [Schistosoma japonicum]|nr:Egg protein [Schistosoma japonicum]
MIVWDPIYNDSTSSEYIQLFSHFCNKTFLWANNSVPPGSNGGKCENVVFTPGNITKYENTSYLGVNATLTLYYIYPTVLSIDIDSLTNTFTSVFQKSNTSSFLEIVSSALTISVNIITEEIPLERSTFGNIVRISMESVPLRNTTSDGMIAWDPVYSDATSHECIQLSTAFCQLVLNWATNALPLRSDGGQCSSVTLSPVNVSIYDRNVAFGVGATLLLTLRFSHEVNISESDIFNGLKAAYESSRIFSFLQILYTPFEDDTDEVQPEQMEIESDTSHTATTIRTSYAVLSTTKASTTEASSSTTMHENPFKKITTAQTIEMTVNNFMNKPITVLTALTILIFVLVTSGIICFICTHLNA